MAKPNYQYEKRQRELAKKKKKEEKLKRKTTGGAENDAPAETGEAMPVVGDAATTGSPGVAS